MQCDTVYTCCSLLSCYCNGKSYIFEPEALCALCEIFMEILQHSTSFCLFHSVQKQPTAGGYRWGKTSGSPGSPTQHRGYHPGHGCNYCLHCGVRYYTLVHFILLLCYCWWSNESKVSVFQKTLSGVGSLNQT